MAIKNSASGAKEHEQRSSAVLRFQKLFGRNPQLCDLERAWDYYGRLPAKKQQEIRAYQPENGEIDLKRFYDRVSYLSPSGIADVVGQAILKAEVWGAFTLSLEEASTGRNRSKTYKAKRR